MKKISLLLVLLWINFLGCLPNGKTPPPKGMVLIPAGEFKMGADESSVIFDVMSDKLEGKDASPMHIVYLGNYYIDMYETTYKKYVKFQTKLEKFISGREYYPISGVTWYEADAFCRWAKKKLPTESQWEKAARGTGAYLYSWGNKFDEKKANLGKTLLYVGSVITDKSPYGIYDMVGNVSEWTSSWYKPYPNSTYTNEFFGEKFKVARGGSYDKDQKHSYAQVFSQTTFRYSNPPNTAAFDTGFRCVSSKN